jgi:hypothetical protein
MRLDRFWQEYFSYDSPLNEMLVFLLMNGPWNLEFTFSAVDGGEKINNVIGNAFDAVMTASWPGRIDIDKIDAEYERLRRIAEGLDARVHVDTALSLASEDQPFSVFNAG